MANLSKMKRDEMIAFLDELKKTHSDDASIRAFNMIENHLREKKYGLVWEEHSEEVDELLEENIPVLTADPERRLCKDESLPWNFIIEGDNLQALYLLEKTHRGKVDCIYIDPPYNTGAKDWKYNNDYVDGNDVYRHSKWLSMMKNRLLLAKHLLNPDNSVLIVTIDEKEYLHLGCLLEEMFPTAEMQMVTSVMNAKGAVREGKFSRVEEYIFIVTMGNACVHPLQYNMLDTTMDDVKSIPEPVEWLGFRRRESTSVRTARPNQFYPIFVNNETGNIQEIGDRIDYDVPRESVSVPSGCTAMWPLKPDGTEMLWGLTPDVARVNWKNGYLRVNNWNSQKKTGTLQYLQGGVIKGIADGIIEVTGRNSDGSVIAQYRPGTSTISPKRVWNVPSHNAENHGTNMVKKFLGKRKFPFPKSVYAVEDVMKFFIKDNKQAMVVDFFAGSGTTMHAVNLLNAEDDGMRKCIMVTNNEVSAEEASELTKKGYRVGDLEWEKYGIAKYVTWPRTICSINGVDLDGKAVKGDYLTSDISGEKLPISRGFRTNVKYFKCSWTPRKPEDYLLSNALCLHIREMIELQNAIEVDNVKNCLILSKSDFKNIILNPEIYAQAENIWVNQNIIFNAEELKLLEAKGYKFIPREFFGQELREAAE